MKDDKKSLNEILPEDEKKNADKYADHLKSPLDELEDKGKTVNDAKNESDEDEDK